VKRINDGTHNVPEKTISIFGIQQDKSYPSIEDLRGNFKRDWFSDKYYFCLPITIANQLGFAITSLFDFNVKWDGGTGKDSIKIWSDDIVEDGIFGSEKQKVYSYFGNGTFTISHDFIINTPPEVNLFITQPPNSFITGCATMAALVETDNLVRDFTFTVKVTVPNIDISIKKGDMLAVMIPMQRYFPDSFEIKNAFDLFDTEILKGSLNSAIDMAKGDVDLYEERGFFGGLKEDEKQNLGMYYLGKFPEGSDFPSHQRKLKKSKVIK
jgi:hypothetical protein